MDDTIIHMEDLKELQKPIEDLENQLTFLRKTQEDPKKRDAASKAAVRVKKKLA